MEYGLHVLSSGGGPLAISCAFLLVGDDGGDIGTVDHVGAVNTVGDRHLDGEGGNFADWIRVRAMISSLL